MNEAAQRTIADGPQLRTLLLTDLCDSTAMVERIGDVAAADLFREHDGLVLQLQQQWRGRLIDRSDGLLLLFERPIDGLGFALDYERGLQVLGQSRNLQLRARAGLHVGEVLTWRNSDAAVRLGAKPLEVEGLAKPMAARLMSMARPGQILLSAVAEPLVHRAARELGERGQHLIWKPMGRWRFKGVPESQYIFEVGEPGIAPLRAPPNTPKAWRDVPLWRRPAALAAEAALLAAVGVGVWFVTRPQPAIAFNQRDWVVVADLRNLTGQSVLDDSLEQAFRISLEQSRYVNVLSDLKARDTLARMQRKPDTALDRAIASEIALRDGARAVILPTVAEVGGKVRVSAEVIDPHTQTTVYTQSADGAGLDSALASIDEVTASLRGKLGEAVQSIEKDSAPLPQVTTRNLDALRAYALGNAAYARRDRDDALAYFQRATELDPSFALAYIGQLRIQVSRGEVALANSLLGKAQSLRNHLPPRDALYLDAWAADLGPEAERRAPPKWKRLAVLYPDYFAGHANYAQSMRFQGHYAEALVHARQAAVPQNPLRAIAFEEIGRVQLALDRPRDALTSFRRSLEGGSKGSRQYAAAFAATGDYKQAEVILATASPDDPSWHLEKVAVAVDRGQWSRADEAAKAAVASVEGHDPIVEALFAVVGLSVRDLLDPNSVAPGTDRALVERIVDGMEGTESYAGDRIYFALATVHLAQRRGDTSLDAVLPRLSRLARQAGDPRVHELLVVTEANRLRLAGDHAGAVLRLKGLMAGGELFQAHVALADALRDAGDHVGALEQYRWLASHRGRAYAESAGGYVFEAANVAQTHLARLHAAQALATLGRVEEARREIELFRAAWPERELPDYLRRSLAATLPASKQ